MQKRFVSIWFRYFKTDWYIRRHPEVNGQALVYFTSEHGRMIITAANDVAETNGIFPGTVLADARAVVPSIRAVPDDPAQFEKVLIQFAQWFIRYSPAISIDAPDGLLIDASGCCHLWEGEEHYIKTIQQRLWSLGYKTRIAMAGTPGCAWALSHFGMDKTIVSSGDEAKALINLPPQSLRIEKEVSERLHKLGLRQVKDFFSMPRSSLRRRFGKNFVTRIEQAVGVVEEELQPVLDVQPYSEFLPSLEPIVTLPGIEIALKLLIERLCYRLSQEGKGVRCLTFHTHRVEGKHQQLQIGTNRSTLDQSHLFKLFEIKLGSIEPGLGIELFLLEASKVEDHSAVQEQLWSASSCSGDIGHAGISQLLDRITNKIGENKIKRYVPDEHYWPERSFKISLSLEEKPSIDWDKLKPRPLYLMRSPETISVAAPVPDYPPMLFRYRGKVHRIIKADGPERIEQEWWLQDGLHRDYYYVEDEEGRRYWLFRSGHYGDQEKVSWFIHGFCA